MPRMSKLVIPNPPVAKEAELLQGTLDLLILKIVALEPLHGYGIVQRLQQMSKEALQVRQGSLAMAARWTLSCRTRDGAQSIRG